MSDYQEFVIDQRKGQIVYECKTKIENLFQVKVTFTNGATAQGQGMLWIGLKGEQEQRSKAQDYIKALTSPEERNPVSFPVSLVAFLGANTKAHVQLESEYGVVVSYPQKTQAVIVGNPISVALATSKLEDLKENLAKTPEPKANQQLQGFALKLGYDQADISAVFDKLGPEIDKNTFLKELINFSKERSRTVEDRRSPVQFHNGASARPNGYLRDTFPRHPGDIVASQGLPSGSGMNHLNGINPRGFLAPDNSGVIARGVVRPTAPTSQASGVLARGVVRTTPQPSQPTGNPMLYSMSNLDYSNMHNGVYMMPGNEFNQVNSDGRQEEQMFQDLLRNGCRYQQFPSSDLRHIVIDGSNVAMSHGNNKVFSCKGIALCVEFFRRRGHTQITVFVPQWRKESPKPETPITDQHLLNQLEEDGYLTFTPSRRINGRRIVCYDDRFVVRLADSTDGIIVSNDNFKDLAQENPKWKEVTERRLLMYSFVNDMFMPPDDPLGRRGPTLDEFLHKGTPSHRRVCPYGRRCTYGTRCKYHHPEREDTPTRLQIYTTLKDMFPSKDALILNVMKKYPQEKNAESLASRILDLTYAE